MQGYPGCQRAFFRSEAVIVSGEAVIVILPREKKKLSGRGSYKPHFHAILKPNKSPNRFLRNLFPLFVIDMSACVAMMRETAQKLSQDEESETVKPNITSSIYARQSFNSFM